MMYPRRMNNCIAVIEFGEQILHSFQKNKTKNNLNSLVFSLSVRLC